MQMTENADGTKSVEMSSNADDIIYTMIPSNKVRLDHWTIDTEGVLSVRAIKHGGGEFIVTGKDINDCLHEVQKVIENES
jgi:hypothetical protein